MEGICSGTIPCTDSLNISEMIRKADTPADYAEVIKAIEGHENEGVNKLRELTSFHYREIAEKMISKIATGELKLVGTAFNYNSHYFKDTEEYFLVQKVDSVGSGSVDLYGLQVRVSHSQSGDVLSALIGRQYTSMRFSEIAMNISSRSVFDKAYGEAMKFITETDNGGRTE